MNAAERKKERQERVARVLEEYRRNNPPQENRESEPGFTGGAHASSRGVSPTTSYMPPSKSGPPPAPPHPLERKEKVLWVCVQNLVSSQGVVYRKGATLTLEESDLPPVPEGWRISIPEDLGARLRESHRKWEQGRKRSEYQTTLDRALERFRTR